MGSLVISNISTALLAYKLILLLGLSIIVSFLDGRGLAMFIQLLKAVGDGQTQQTATDNAQSLGQIQVFVNFIRRMGFELTITTVLVLLAMLFAFKGVMKYTQMKFYAGLREQFIKKCVIVW